MKKVIIIGAGPAGLTAGYDLLSKSSDYEVTIVEESSVVGGLCARFENEENVLDAGGHMYISNNSAVKQFWYSVLPAQGVPSSDDLVLDRYCKIHNGGPDPEVSEDVLLSREKLTRIYKDNKFFESPVKFNKDAVKNFGFANSIKTGFSQIGNNVFKHKELTLEDYYINRFGKQLYNMFIEEYLEKIWGKEPSRINSEWGVVAEKSLIAPVISTEKNNNRDYEKLPAPYATRYYYPKYGAYQLWETAADRFIEMGGSIHKNCKVTGITTGPNKILSVRCSADGDEFVVACDYLISSMPIRDLILGMDDVDGNVSLAAENLSYRGMVSVCVELTELNWKNDTEDYKTIDDIIPDSVLYISNPNVKVSRIQVYNNFSPYMIRNPKHYYLGLNYYCNEGDYYWSMGNRDWKKTVVNDLVKLGIIKSEDSIIGYNKTKYSKAFPTYYDGYEGLDKIIKYLDKYENLYCVGRNGQHRFSSIDEVMKTSFEAVKNILGNVSTKDNIWKANEKNDEEGKLYNSALLSGEGEYKGNYVPLQKKIDFDNNEENKDYVPPRRMRRPMMTPIKKADPNKLSEPIVLNDSVVIAARPEKSIPIAEPDAETVQAVAEVPRFETEEFEENITFETPADNLNVQNVSYEETVIEDNNAAVEEPQIDLFAAAEESILQEELENKQNAYVDETEEQEENVIETVVTEEAPVNKKPELTNEFLDELLGLDFGDKPAKPASVSVEIETPATEEIAEDASDVSVSEIEDSISVEENIETAVSASEDEDTVIAVSEENVESSKLDDFEVVDQIDAAIDEEISSKAAAANANNEITDEESEEEVFVSPEESIENETSEENTDDAEIIEEPETSELSQETEIETVSEESVTEELPDTFETAEEHESANALETEELNSVSEVPVIAESNKESIPEKSFKTSKGNKERRSKRNFSFNLLTPSETESAEEKKEEKPKKEVSEDDGFSLPGGGRSVFSRRSRSSNSVQNNVSRRNRINLTELSETYGNTVEENKDFANENAEAKDDIAEITNNAVENEVAEEVTDVKVEETKAEETKAEETKAEKGKPSFGRTSNFKADNESETERLVTREQAIGDNTDAEKVEFSKADKFKTDDLTDSTNPHERFIKKDESIKEGTKGTFRVTSSFNSSDFPEEKRIERPAYWDKELIYKAKEEAKQKELEEAARAKAEAEALEKSNEDNSDNANEENAFDDLSENAVFEENAAEESIAENIKEESSEKTDDNTVVEGTEESINETPDEETEESIDEDKGADSIEETSDTSVEEAVVTSFEETPVEETEKASFEETAVEEEINSSEENSYDEVSFDETSSENSDDVKFDEIPEVSSEDAEAEEELSFEEASIEVANEEAAFDESNIENAEEVAFEEASDEESDKDFVITENVVNDTAEEAAEDTFEEFSEETTEEAVEETTEEVTEDTVEENKESFEEFSSEESKEISFEETLLEETVADNVIEDGSSYEETLDAAEINDSSDFDKAAEDIEEENDDLSVIDEQAASRSIVKSWQNRYNGVGTSYLHEKKDDDRVVRSGSISNDLYGQNFALSSVGKKGIMDHELDDLDGGKEYVTKSAAKGTIIKSETYSSSENTENKRPEKDLSGYKIIKESDVRFDSSSEKKEEIKEEVIKEEAKSFNPANENTVKPQDSISPSPAKPVGEKRSDFLRKDIDTSIVFRNARVIKTTKITRNIDEEPQIKKEEKKEKVYSDKQKVIAVIRNGEVIPVNNEEKKEEPAPEEAPSKKTAKADNAKGSRKKKKRGKNKKEAEDSSEELMQAPISVMLDAKEAASMTEPLESPVARTRNFKI